MSDTIHSRIKQRRIKLGLSMEALAKMAGLKSWQSVQQWENGDTAPNRNRLERVANALQTTKEYLLSGSPARPKNTGVAHLTESVAAPYVHPDPQIAKIVALLEHMTDVGIGEVLRAAKDAAKEHKKVSVRQTAS